MQNFVKSKGVKIGLVVLIAASALFFRNLTKNQDDKNAVGSLSYNAALASVYAGAQVPVNAIANPGFLISNSIGQDKISCITTICFTGQNSQCVALTGSLRADNSCSYDKNQKDQNAQNTLFILSQGSAVTTLPVTPFVQTINNGITQPLLNSKI